MAKKKIVISCIEVSADLHGAKIVKAIKALAPNLEFIGFGSEALKAEGVTILKDLTHRSTVGMIEPIKHLFSYLSALKQLKNLLKKERPAAFFCIDGQGFHLLVAKEAKKLGIPVIYYISPQEWLWGTPAGGKKVAALCDLIIAIFPEEAAFYRKLGAQTVYHGHPLVDIVKSTLSKKEFKQKYKLPQNKPLIALFPGSRRQELSNFLPIILKATEYFRDVQFAIVAANNYCAKTIQKLAAHYQLPVISNDNYNAITASELIISSTGTITLEAALLETPVVSIYKLSDLSYWLLTKTIGSRLPKYMALPNLLAKAEISPEIIQQGVTPENIAAVARDLLAHPQKLAKIKQHFKVLRKALFRQNILANNAREFVNFISK